MLLCHCLSSGEVRTGAQTEVGRADLEARVDVEAVGGGDAPHDPFRLLLHSLLFFFFFQNNLFW